MQTLNEKIGQMLANERIAELAAEREAAKAKNIIVNHTVVRPIIRQSQDINKWRQALMSAEQDHEQRQWLYDLYHEIMLDGRLMALIEQRVSRITNTPLQFGVAGKTNDDLCRMATSSFFRKALREVLLARFWGHTLIELYWPTPEQGKGTTNLVNRKHVKPRRGIVTKNAFDIEGLQFREAPYNAFCLEAGERDDLGILLACCPYIIYKRGGFGDWAEFAEVFGMPFRWATYQNEQSRGILEKALSEAGAAGFVVAPQDAQLQFHNPTAGSNSNDIFRFLIEQCNQELAITVLGNTMTTAEAKHSGYAQSETHRDTQDAVHQDDRAYVLSWLNETLNPYLESIGWKIKKGQWSFVDGDGLSLTQRADLDLKINAVAPVARKYWYEKYGLPMPEPDEVEEPEPDTDDEQSPGKRKAGQRDEG